MEHKVGAGGEKAALGFARQQGRRSFSESSKRILPSSGGRGKGKNSCGPCAVMPWQIPIRRQKWKEIDRFGRAFRVTLGPRTRFRPRLVARPEAFWKEGRFDFTERPRSMKRGHGTLRCPGRGIGWTATKRRCARSAGTPFRSRAAN